MYITILLLLLGYFLWLNYRLYMYLILLRYRIKLHYWSNKDQLDRDLVEYTSPAFQFNTDIAEENIYRRFQDWRSNQ